MNTLPLTGWMNVLIAFRTYSIGFGQPHRDILRAPVHFPGVDNVGVGDHAVKIGFSLRKKRTIRVEVKDAGIRDRARAFTASANRRTGSPAAPHVIHDQRAPSL